MLITNIDFMSVNYQQIENQIDREYGKQVLKTAITIEKNINIIENNIFNKVHNYDQYKDLIISTITKIKSGQKLNKVLTDIKTNNFGYSEQYFKEVADVLQEQHNFIENPFEVEEGVMECKCGSKKTISFSKQIRSGDEGTTVFAKCVDCGKTWKT